jgi:glycosyltransferase involved in cell wall biosynthesis
VYGDKDTKKLKNGNKQDKKNGKIYSFVIGNSKKQTNVSEHPPLISILIPVYNTAEYLPACLDSIVGQSYSRLEIIALNDGSTDNSLIILEDYARRDNRIRVIDKPNEGLILTRKRAVPEASGNFICFIDSDDYIDPDYISKLYDAIAASGLDIASGELLKVSEGYTSLVPRNTPDIMIGHEFLRHLLRGDLFAAVAGKLYRAEVLKPVEYFRGISLMEDYIINVQVAMSHGFKGICFVNDALYYYIQRGASIVHQRISFDYIERFAAAFDGLFDARPDLVAEFYRELLTHRISRYHMYIKRSSNQWVGNRPLALETYRAVKANHHKLRGLVPCHMTVDIVLYRHRWLRPLVMVSSVLERWKSSIEKRTRHRAK